MTVVGKTCSSLACSCIGYSAFSFGMIAWHFVKSWDTGRSLHIIRFDKLYSCVLHSSWALSYSTIQSLTEEGMAYYQYNVLMEEGMAYIINIDNVTLKYFVKLQIRCPQS